MAVVPCPELTGAANGVNKFIWTSFFTTLFHACQVAGQPTDLSAKLRFRGVGSLKMGNTRDRTGARYNVPILGVLAKTLELHLAQSASNGCYFLP